MELSIHMTASIDANTGSPPTPANALGSAFPSSVTSDNPPVENQRSAERNALPALHAPTKALKNARIRHPLRGNAQSLAADVRVESRIQSTIAPQSSTLAPQSEVYVRHE
jgi:hypothetical protein